MTAPGLVEQRGEVADDATVTPGAFVLRLVVVGLSAVIAVALLLLFLAWIALRIPWQVPEVTELSGPTVVTDRNGEVLARFTSAVDRRVVDLDQVSQAARDAIVAAEDIRFYEHTGVDPASLIRAVVTNVRTGGISQGGSTLTQQYVKNAYLNPERTLTRKIREAVISIALERRMSKDEILEAYLNAVYFGEGAYGIEAAALTYFGVPAAELTADHGATLAQLLPAPSVRNPRADSNGARQRRDRVLDQMVLMGTLTRAEADQFQTLSIDVRPRLRQQFAVPYFTEYVRRQIVANYGEEGLLTGAMTVRTTIDLAAQAALEQAVTEQLPRQEPPLHDVDAGAAIVDPKSGDILAVYGGRSYEESQLDLATQLTIRENGSNFKPFVFVAALEQGLSATTSYAAPASIVPTSCPPNEDGSNPFARNPVDNAGGRGYGRLTLANALANSVNTVYVTLGCDVGPDNVVTTMRKMGVRSPIPAHPNIGIGGGGSEGATPLDLASAYATIANDGRHCPARSIIEVRTRNGERLPAPVEVTIGLGQEAQPRALTEDELAARPEGLAELDRGRCKQVIDPDIARTTAQTLTRVVSETTATRADIGRPQAGKTGTSDGPKDAWFTGFTPDLALSVWVGDAGRDEGPLEVLRNVEGFRTVFGGTIPALIWRDAASEILKDVPPRGFLRPGEGGEGGRRPAPERVKPDPTPSEAPSEVVSDLPSDDPSASENPTDQPSGEPSPTPSDEPSRCLIVFSC